MNPRKSSFSLLLHRAVGAAKLLDSVRGYDNVTLVTQPRFILCQNVRAGSVCLRNWLTF